MFNFHDSSAKHTGIGQNTSSAQRVSDMPVGM